MGPAGGSANALDLRPVIGGEMVDPVAAVEGLIVAIVARRDMDTALDIGSGGICIAGIGHVGQLYPVSCVGLEALQGVCQRESMGSRTRDILSSALPVAIPDCQSATST